MKRCYVGLLTLSLAAHMHAHVISEALGAINGAAVLAHQNGIIAKEVGEKGAKVADAVLGEKVGRAKYAVELAGFAGGSAVGHFAAERALDILSGRGNDYALSGAVTKAAKEAVTEVEVKIALDAVHYVLKKAGISEEQFNELLNFGDHLKLAAVDSRLAALVNLLSHNAAYAVFRGTVKELLPTHFNESVVKQEE